jgi:hydroxymethylglutaryl-CoA synthase
MDIGTETMLDMSKSIRTVLMDLFKTGAVRKVNGDCSMQEDIDCEPNIDIEGADVKNACFGGTQALFNAIDWLYSNYEFEGHFFQLRLCEINKLGRMAIAVCADVAVYDRGPARCTGGAGAIAFLLGPHAPLVFDRGLRACDSNNIYDFYKPVSGTCTEYPVVNGSESIDEYILAVRKCYSLYVEKYRRQNGNGKKLIIFLI